MAGRNREGIGMGHHSSGNAQRIVSGVARTGECDVAGDRRRSFILLGAADRRRRRHRGRCLGIRYPANDDPTGTGTLAPEKTYYRLSLFRLC